MERRNTRCAVLTDSVVVRGIVTALRWFGLPVRVLAKDDIDAALTFAGVPSLQLPQAARMLRSLHESVTNQRTAAT